MTSDLKEKIKKAWRFIWESDSPWSWILNVALAFIIVKFIIYPGLGLLLGTTHPVVAVVSGSMSHNLENKGICGSMPNRYKNTFDDYWGVCGYWYKNNNINKETATNWKFRNGFNKGDIMVLKGVKESEINVGDVIVFKSTMQYLQDPIIHRTVKKDLVNNDYVFQTKGDHNSGQIKEHGEYYITMDRIVGKAVFRIPFLGWIKIIAVEIINSIRGFFVSG